jgi:hypothetical protein
MLQYILSIKKTEGAENYVAYINANFTFLCQSVTKLGKTINLFSEAMKQMISFSIN